MIMVGSFKIVFNQSCFLSVENNNMYETNNLPKEEITNADIFFIETIIIKHAFSDVMIPYA